MKQRKTAPKYEERKAWFDHPKWNGQDNGPSRTLPPRETETHAVETAEHDVFKLFKGGKKEYWYTHRFTSRRKLVLHIGGPHDGKYGLAKDGYVPFNNTERNHKHMTVCVHKPLLK